MNNTHEREKKSAGPHTWPAHERVRGAILYNLATSEEENSSYTNIEKNSDILVQIVIRLSSLRLSALCFICFRVTTVFVFRFTGQLFTVVFFLPIPFMCVYWGFVFLFCIYYYFPIYILIIIFIIRTQILSTSFINSSTILSL